MKKTNKKTKNRFIAGMVTSSLLGLAVLGGGGYYLSTNQEAQDWAKNLLGVVDQVQLDTSTENNAALQAQLDALQADYVALQTSAAALEAEVATKNTSIAALTAERDALQVDVTNLTAQLSAEESDNVTLTAQIAALNAQIVTLNADIVTMTAERDAIQAQLDAVTIDDINVSILDKFLEANNEGVVFYKVHVNVYDSENSVEMPIDEFFLQGDQFDMDLSGLIQDTGQTYYVYVTAYKDGFIPFTISFTVETVAPQLNTTDIAGLSALEEDEYVQLQNVIVTGFRSSATVYLEDASGYSLVYDGGWDWSTVSIGDMVNITGYKSSYNGVDQLANIASLEIISSGNATSAATPLTTENLADYICQKVTLEVTYIGESAWGDLVVSYNGIEVTLGYFDYANEMTPEDIAAFQGGATATVSGIVRTNGTDIIPQSAADIVIN